MSAAEPETGEQATTYNLLFVCTGNTCRSPMAEALTAHELSRRGWSHVRVGSAGVAADEGAPASPQVHAVLGDRGLDARAHRARQLSPELVEWADLVLAMSPSHADVVRRLGGEHKVALLGEFAAGEPGGGVAVRDPFGGEVELYARTLRQLEDLIGSSLDRLAPILQP